MLKYFFKPPKVEGFFKHYSDYPIEHWRWEDFTPAEIASRTVVYGRRGPKGPLLVDTRALDMLQALRDKINKPMFINSAYRTSDYNRFIGATPRSKHRRGIAFDVSMHNHNVGEFVKAAREVGFKGIGYYSTFTHIDARDTEAEWYG